MANQSEQYGIWSKGRRTNWLSDIEINNLANNEQFFKILQDKS